MHLCIVFNLFKWVSVAIALPPYTGVEVPILISCPTRRHLRTVKNNTSKQKTCAPSLTLCRYVIDISTEYRGWSTEWECIPPASVVSRHFLHIQHVHEWNCRRHLAIMRKYSSYGGLRRPQTSTKGFAPGIRWGVRHKTCVSSTKAPISTDNIVDTYST